MQAIVNICDSLIILRMFYTNKVRDYNIDNMSAMYIFWVSKLAIFFLYAMYLLWHIYHVQDHTSG